jgi:hypothetical protein
MKEINKRSARIHLTSYFIPETNKWIQIKYGRLIVIQQMLR